MTMAAPSPAPVPRLLWRGGRRKVNTECVALYPKPRQPPKGAPAGDDKRNGHREPLLGPLLGPCGVLEETDRSRGTPEGAADPRP